MTVFPASLRANTGTAIETIRGRPRKTVFFGTYGQDMPDPHFRFNICFIDNTQPFPLHAHDYTELLVVLDGQATHVTDFGRHPLLPGDVLVIHPPWRHGLADIRQLRLCIVMFDTQRLLGRAADLHEMSGFRNLFLPPGERPELFPQRLALEPVHLVRALQWLSHLKEEFDRREPGYESVVRGTFLCLVTFLARAYQNPRPSRPPTGGRLERVIAQLKKKFREPLHVSDLARLANLSPSQFRRTFKQTYNVTPKHFVNHLRLQAACELLADPQRPITEVAMESGFSSSSLFSSQFRVAYGQSPSTYRRQRLTEQRRGIGV